MTPQLRSRRLLARLGLALSILAPACGPASPPESGPQRQPEAGASAGQGGGAAGSTAAPDLPTIFEEGCATSSVQAELLPSTLLFVIDRSSSMACNPPPVTQSVDCELNATREDARTPTKWEIVRRELLATLDSLPNSTFAGLSYFSNDDVCGVHSRPSVEIAQLSREQRSAINVSLSHVEPSGATPLVGAVILAYGHLHDAALAGRLQGNKFVVLLTDGEHSEECVHPVRCNSAQQCTEQLVSIEVPKAAGPGVGIKTFVIGAPGSEPARRVLSQIAVHGETSPPGCSVEQGTCHFDMTRQPEFAPALASALKTITGRALSCDFPLPRRLDVAVDPATINIVYSPGSGAPAELIFKDDQAACEAGANGWQFSSDGSRIRLCGPACRRVRSDTTGRVHIVLGCRVRVPQ